MGTANKKSKDLSPELQNDIMAVFKKLDIDGSKAIDKEETLKFWKGNFPKLNTDELFRTVDKDNSGEITEAEWIAFWQEAKKSGYTEKAIKKEIEGLLSGEAWDGFQAKQKQKQKKK